MVTRRRLSSAETGPALEALSRWTPADVPGGGLHPGDVGWHLRFPDSVIDLWSVDGEPVAVGFLDDDVLRVTVAPGAGIGELPDGVDRCDGVRPPGWKPLLEEPWVVFSWAPREVSSRATSVGESDAADRVLVQRAAFTGSTFTVERWQAMKRSPAGALAVETLVRTPSGEPAAAATGWFAGPGRCGLLEPVGAHPDHRGHGYGRDAVLGACDALARRGAAAVAVVTPAANTAAVALYKSAGFTIVRENHDWVRPS